MSDAVPEESHPMSVSAPRLREAREFLGLPVEGVAKALGLSPVDIHDIESAQRSVSGVELRKFSRLYVRDVEWLCGAPSQFDPSSLGPLPEGISEQDRRCVEQFAEFLDRLGKQRMSHRG